MAVSDAALGVAAVVVVIAAVPWRQWQWQCDKFHAQMFDTRRRIGQESQ